MIPEGTQGGNKEYTASSHQTAATLKGSAWETLNEKTQDTLAPDNWGAYQRNNFSKLSFLYLPKDRKALNLLI